MKRESEEPCLHPNQWFDRTLCSWCEGMHYYCEVCRERTDQCFRVVSSRPSWDDYFIGIARAVAARADCSRRQIGAVVVRDNRIVSTGYNGSPPGGPSCLAGECPRSTSNVPPGSSYDSGPGACIAVHAELNALLYAGIDGCKGSTLYITDQPCDGCAKIIAASGIECVVTP